MNDNVYTLIKHNYHKLIRHSNDINVFVNTCMQRLNILKYIYAYMAQPTAYRNLNGMSGLKMTFARLFGQALTCELRSLIVIASKESPNV